MLTARTHRLSPFVHAVDDAGSLCGARPRRGWVANSRMPLTCPGCLVRSGLPRYAYCGVPSGKPDPVRHIRLVGAEGFTRKGGAGRRETLCGAAAGWDESLVAATPPAGTDGVCAVCVRELRRARTGLPVDA